MARMNILIIPDKFKGTLGAGAAAEAIARGWRRARPADSLTLLPMSDGGDGFGEVMSLLLGAEPRTLQTVNAAHRPCTAPWWWEARSRTAIIESARIIGLAMLPPGRFHPFDLDTAGLGAIIPALAAAGARRCLVGIGGSATNDGGFGLARALGWRFLDSRGEPIEQWAGLDRLAGVKAPRRRRWFKQLRVAVDVQNRLLGSRSDPGLWTAEGPPQRGACPRRTLSAPPGSSSPVGSWRATLPGSLAPAPPAASDSVCWPSWGHSSNRAFSCLPAKRRLAASCARLTSSSPAKAASTPRRSWAKAPAKSPANAATSTSPAPVWPALSATPLKPGAPSHKPKR